MIKRSSKQENIESSVPELGQQQSLAIEIDENVLHHRFDGVRNVLRTAKQEFKESPNKKRTLLAGAQLMITQGLDRARFAILIIPPAVVKTMEHTNNSLVAGAVGAGMMALWGVVVGESTLRGLDEFPESVEVFEEEHPKFVNFFTEVLPGIQSGGPSRSPFEEPSVAENVGTHTRRALSSVSIGTSPYVATAKATGYNNPETRRLYANTSADGAGFAFLLAAGMTEGIKQLALEGRYELAQDIQNIVENNMTWWALAGLSIAGELISNRRKSKKQLN